MDNPEVVNDLIQTTGVGSSVVVSGLLAVLYGLWRFFEWAKKSRADDAVSNSMSSAALEMVNGLRQQLEASQAREEKLQAKLEEAWQINTDLRTTIRDDLIFKIELQQEINTLKKQLTGFPTAPEDNVYDPRYRQHKKGTSI